MRKLIIQDLTPLPACLVDVTDPTVTSTTTDIFGNKTVSVSVQDFEIHVKTGQAKMMSMTTTKSETVSIDGSVTTLAAPYTMAYAYNDQGFLIDAKPIKGARLDLLKGPGSIY